MIYSLAEWRSHGPESVFILKAPEHISVNANAFYIKTTCTVSQSFITEMRTFV